MIKDRRSKSVLTLEPNVQVASARYRAIMMGGRTLSWVVSWGHVWGQDDLRTCPNYYCVDLDKTARKRLGQGLIPFWDDFFFQHKLRNGELIALPVGRANVGGLGARHIRRHHGERNCHVSLEWLRGTAPLTDLLVPQGHLCPIGSSSSLGSPPRE